MGKNGGERPVHACECLVPVRLSRARKCTIKGLILSTNQTFYFAGITQEINSGWSASQKKASPRTIIRPLGQFPEPTCRPRRFPGRLVRSTDGNIEKSTRQRGLLCCTTQKPIIFCKTHICNVLRLGLGRTLHF